MTWLAFTLLLAVAAVVSARPTQDEEPPFPAMPCGNHASRENENLCRSFNGGNVCVWNYLTKPHCRIAVEAPHPSTFSRDASKAAEMPEKPADAVVVIVAAKTYGPQVGDNEIQRKAEERERWIKYHGNSFGSFDNSPTPQCLLDVPMCQRIACGGRGAQTNAAKCYSDPRCCFDYDLYLHQYSFGINFLDGAPACYYGPTSAAYQKVADLINPPSPWYSSTIMDIFKSQLTKPLMHHGQDACANVDAYENMCGWEAITENECKLKQCCYTSMRTCVYPNVQAMKHFQSQGAYPELQTTTTEETQCNADPFLSEKIYNRLPCQRLTTDPYSVTKCHPQCCLDKHAIPSTLNTHGFLSGSHPHGHGGHESHPHGHGGHTESRNSPSSPSSGGWNVRDFFTSGQGPSISLGDIIPFPMFQSHGGSDTSRRSLGGNQQSVNPAMMYYLLNSNEGNSRMNPYLMSASGSMNMPTLMLMSNTLGGDDSSKDDPLKQMVLMNMLSNQQQQGYPPQQPGYPPQQPGYPPQYGHQPYPHQGNQQYPTPYGNNQYPDSQPKTTGHQSTHNMVQDILFGRIKDNLDIRCPYAYAKIGKFPDISKSLRLCCEINSCFHKKQITAPKTLLSPPSYGGWSEWTPCDRTCGSNGFKSRVRVCVTEGRSPGQCSGPAYDFQACQLKPCEADFHQNNQQFQNNVVTSNVQTESENPEPSDGGDVEDLDALMAQLLGDPSIQTTFDPADPNSQFNQPLKPNKDEPEPTPEYQPLDNPIDINSINSEADWLNFLNQPAPTQPLPDTPNTSQMPPVPQPSSSSVQSVDFGSMPSDLDFTNTPSSSSYSQWSRWTRCDRTCGGGLKIRVRVCQKPGTCSGPREEMAECQTQQCGGVDPLSFEVAQPDGDNFPSFPTNAPAQFSGEFQATTQPPSPTPDIEPKGDSDIADNNPTLPPVPTLPDGSVIPELQYAFGPWGNWSDCKSVGDECTGVGQRERTRLCFSTKDGVNYDEVGQCEGSTEVETCMAPCFPQVPEVEDQSEHSQQRKLEETGGNGNADEGTNQLPTFTGEGMSPHSSQPDAAGDEDDGEWTEWSKCDAPCPRSNEGMTMREKFCTKKSAMCSAVGAVIVAQKSCTVICQ